MSRSFLSHILDKDYCSDYEQSLHFLSLDELVFYYGDRENWWGDFDAHETRTLYHKLLPRYHPQYLHIYPIDVLAYKTYQARKAAKSYAKRRSFLYVRLFSCFVDVLMNMWAHQSLKSLSYPELWKKYELQAIHQYDDDHHDNNNNHPRDLHSKTASIIVRKSCTTNQWIDSICL